MGLTNPFFVFNIKAVFFVPNVKIEDGFWVVGAAGESTVGLDEASHNGPMALVMGSEGSGLRRLTREVCDALVAIPMPGHIESLNVSVATGVLLYDLQNRRGALDASRAYEERV